jgi:enolase
LQDFLIIPTGCEAFSQALERIVRIYNRCKKIIDSRGWSSLKADEGGFSPALEATKQRWIWRWKRLQEIQRSLRWMWRPRTSTAMVSII